MTDLPEPGLYTTTQLLALLRGEPLPDPVEELRRSEEEKKLRRKAVDQWPAFEIVWDLEAVNFHQSGDGCSSSEFWAPYPNGVVLAEVSLTELDAALHTGSRRSAEEVWSIGVQDKTAGAIRHWAEGHGMTPAMIASTSDGWIALDGGNNRLAVARAKGATLVPVLLDHADLVFMQERLPSMQVLGTFRL